MNNVVDFNMITELNNILKDKKIAYSLHSKGGCGCNNIVIKRNGQYFDINSLVIIINNYLKPKYLKVILINDNLLKVESLFDVI